MLELDRSRCADGARVVLEKPFGHDLVSARALNRTLGRVFPERSIFHIDHYLGVAGRGRFYDETGAIRDVVQNHMPQVLTLLAIHPWR